ncbi:MAG: PorP/SprF family type IX secretion system membrane protein, partial [Holophagaceae bacterium]
MKSTSLLFLLCLNSCILFGQDAVFTQFFNAPLANNPALAAYGSNSLNLYTNYRQQWIGASSSYNTMLASVTGKVLGGKVGDNNTLGMGGMFMSDLSLDGAFRSTYASMNIAYLLSLDEEGKSKVGLGLAGIYGSRRVDFSQLTWGQQFNSHGFNTTLPTGESAIGAMNDYISMSAGALFTHRQQSTNIVVGAAGYHFNTPRQTSISDVFERLPTRYVVHGSVESFLTTNLSLSITTLYQSQASSDYFTGGLIANLYPQGEEGTQQIGAGLFYRNTTTISPYVGLTTKSIRFGLT